MGAQIPDGSGVAHPNDPKLIKYEYLSGDVIHYKLVEGGHNAGENVYVKEAIIDFLGY